MKKRNLLASCLVLASLVIGIAACEGPAGPAGPAGTPGPTGPQGPAGSQGATGTANVIYSSWRAASTLGTWTRTTLNGKEKFYLDMSAAPLSQQIMDQGVVMVYLKHPTENNQIRQLPVSIVAQFTEELVDYSLASVGSIRLWSTPMNGPVVPTSNYQFRYVLIPGAQAGRLNYEKLTYQEVKELFNLPD
ncbi:hypothetical protein GCM10027275_47430 [Rhabdobacter roseus]|uniref:Collagen-like protein n=1 Tax=Rhabdobacter roseus TaxID=1655419 RepID=A0A840TXS4_9BACT|nr:hypothetical protein [Rhabdobacter roseus]MBB5286377.1 hypothetical protein [Rhabdobacter roseus]